MQAPLISQPKINARRTKATQKAHKGVGKLDNSDNRIHLWTLGQIQFECMFDCHFAYHAAIPHLAFGKSLWGNNIWATKDLATKIKQPVRLKIATKIGHHNFTHVPLD